MEVFVSLFDNICHDLVDGEIDGENHIRRCLIALKKPGRSVSRNG
jgi:hypothetical protein